MDAHIPNVIHNYLIGTAHTEGQQIGKHESRRQTLIQAFASCPVYWLQFICQGRMNMALPQGQ